MCINVCVDLCLRPIKGIAGDLLQMYEYFLGHVETTPSAW